MNKGNKLIDTDKRIMGTRGEMRVGEEEERVGVKCMVTEGDQTLNGEHTVMYTNVIL